MRIVCPNCGAQYEVDDAAIPTEGRDVQCSSCGHAWFQIRPEPAGRAVPRAILPDEAAAAEPGEERDTAPDPAAQQPGPQAGIPAPDPEGPVADVTSAAPDTEDDEEARLKRIEAALTAPPEEEASAPVAETSPAPVPEPDPPHGAEPQPEPEPEPEGAPAPLRVARSGVDPAIAEILREEAEREARLRRGESPTPEPAPAPIGETAPTPPSRETGPIDPQEAQRRQRLREALERERRLASEGAAGAASSPAAARAPSPEGPAPGADALPEPFATPAARAEIVAEAPGAGASPGPALGPAPRRPSATRPPRPAPVPGSRRDLLPDVEELNATLQDVKEARPEGRIPPSPAATAPRRGGRAFRRGFVLTLLVLFLGAMAYLRPDLVTAFLPEAAPAMEAWGDMVGQVHVVLHQRGSAAMDAIFGMIGRVL